MLNFFNFLFVLIFLFGLTCCLQKESKEDPMCLNLKRNEIESHLSTKSPYRAVANFNDSRLIYPGCHPTRVWSIIRHGARTPSGSTISAAQERLPQIQQYILSQAKSRLCAEELEQLREWQFGYDIKKRSFLTSEGEDELIELAERMQNRFPDLLPDFYDPSFYFFKYTASQRTFKSAESFATGLFGRDRIGDIDYPRALLRDPILRFYKRCQRWKSDVDKNPDTFVNARKFNDEPEMRDAIKFIQQRVQLAEPLTVKDAKLIYTICGSETASERRKRHSVWCNFFNRETIKALEFSEDLEYYWNDGYGYELTRRIACPAIADMLESLELSSKKPNATFYFTHSGALLKVMTHLGLYKDPQPLTYKDFKRPRQWRTSAIDAFATNLAFVRYECTDNEPMVLTLHQERVVHIPGCPADSDLCSLRTLRHLFVDSLDRCNFMEMCEVV